jgi:hypothetical protein
VHGPSGPNPATNTQIQQVAINAAPALSLSASNINVTWVADPNLPTKQDIQVKVKYTYQIQIPFVSAVTANFVSTSQLLVAQ